MWGLGCGCVFQVLSQRRFSHRSDVLAYGCTCSELFSFGLKPYHSTGLSTRELQAEIVKGISFPREARVPPLVYERLILPCLRRQPSERPSFSQLVEIVSELATVHQDDLMASPGEELGVDRDGRPAASTGYLDDVPGNRDLGRSEVATAAQGGNSTGTSAGRPTVGTTGYVRVDATDDGYLATDGNGGQERATCESSSNARDEEEQGSGYLDVGLEEV